MSSVETLVLPSKGQGRATVFRLRPLLRDALVYAGLVLLTPLWLPAWVEKRFQLGENFFTLGAELLSLVPGKPGIFLRRSFYRMTLVRCATDCHIGFGSTFAHPDAEVHPGVYLGSRCTVGKVILQQDATVGSNVDILSGRHQHHTHHTDIPIQDQGGSLLRVRIGHNSWIGNSSVVMADIGEHCIIGAGSVVVRPVPARSVAVGNPAAVKKTRAA